MLKGYNQKTRFFDQDTQYCFKQFKKSCFLAKKVSIRAQTKSTQVVILWEKRELKLAVCGFIIFFFMFVYTVGVFSMSVDDSAR